LVGRREYLSADSKFVLGDGVGDGVSSIYSILRGGNKRK
jgi:hypothetical protein